MKTGTIPPNIRPKIPTIVIALGIVSMLTDASSEMIYPLLPAFLTQVLGATPAALGLIEGIAESTSALLKIASGSFADRMPRRKPLVIVGYGIAGVVRPLVAFAQTWPFVLAVRFTDRVGKGIRSAPRDALLADSTAPENRGAAYGVHRALDHTGAVIGPLSASFCLLTLGLGYRDIFLIAAIPAIVSLVVLFFFVHEVPRKESQLANGKALSFRSLRADWFRLPRELKILLVAIFVFTLGNSSDAFLILRLNDAGISPGYSALAWAGLHVIKVGATWVGGPMSDRLGASRMMVVGWVWYAVIFAAYGLATDHAAIITLFLLYGLHFGFAEPAERALVASLAPMELRGTAFGLFYFVTGMAALPASLLFGWLFQTYGVAVAFCTGGTLALIACLIVWVSLKGLPTKGLQAN